jgi:hypothetical protein
MSEGPREKPQTHPKRSKAEIYDLAKPIEYKDVPIHFTFELDGRREPVKIVEPQIDLPFPAGTRLLVDFAGKRLCEVVFRFDPEKQRPYRLIFPTWKMVRYDDEDLHLDFGEPVNRENATQAVHRMTIVKQGHVKAWIEMSNRKARLQIRYTKGRRIPPSPPFTPESPPDV